MDAGVIHLPKFAPGGVGAGRGEAVEAAGGGVGHFAEDDAVADLVQVDADEVGFLGEDFGVADHVVEAAGARDRLGAAGFVAADAELVPVAVEEVAAMQRREAAGIDLDDFDALVEDEELDIGRWVAVAAVEEFFHQDATRDVAVEPFLVERGEILAEPFAALRDEGGVVERGFVGDELDPAAAMRGLDDEAPRKRGEGKGGGVGGDVEEGRSEVEAEFLAGVVADGELVGGEGEVGAAIVEFVILDFLVVGAGREEAGVMAVGLAISAADAAEGVDFPEEAVQGRPMIREHERMLGCAGRKSEDVPQ